jgi:glycosyltransferase involved in cell wall biosynthesis
MIRGHPIQRVALVHDYLKEYGGAERVLSAFCEMFPQAPIYAAFVTPGSTAAQSFSHRQIIPWKHQWLIKHFNLHSPFRFLIPAIWESFDFSDYDLVISSASGYVTKGIITPSGTRHICYCHTPPRWLYGYPTAANWQKFFPVKIYGHLMRHQLLKYDYQAAQRVDTFIANSKNVARRIKKFYRRNAQVIYPPVDVKKIAKATKNLKTKDYYLVVSRLVGAKGWDLLFQAVDQLNIQIKVVGEPAGFYQPRGFAKVSTPGVRELRTPGVNGIDSANVQWLGRVSDQELWQLYGQCQALLALAQDEDFGITPVEAMAAGRPVIAYEGGGYLETVVDDKTGILFPDYSAASLIKAIQTFPSKTFKPSDCRRRAQQFSREKFIQQIQQLITDHRR